MLNLEEFSKLPEGIFRTGICSNSPTGAFMTREGGVLKYVAVKWNSENWGVYIGRVAQSDESIKRGGDFIHNKETVKGLVSFEPEVMELYYNP